MAMTVRVSATSWLLDVRPCDRQIEHEQGDDHREDQRRRPVSESDSADIRRLADVIGK
jgi:hypothetical protein